MAKEKEKEITLIDAFKDFKEEKSIDRPVMLGVLKDVFLTQLAKTYGSYPIILQKAMAVRKILISLGYVF
jgi:hypothetical protein